MNVEISINSYSEEIKLNCPVCTETVRAEIWIIIDVIERMDLATRILEGSLNSIKCTKCDNEGLFDTPLLLFKSDQHPPLIFSQSSQATEEESRDEAFHLMTVLKNRMGKKWHDEWFSEVCAIKHQFLPTVLSEWLREIGENNENGTDCEPKAFSELDAIFEELDRAANQNDMTRRIELCKQALRLISRAQYPQLWAILQCELGNSLFESRSINRTENLELSIKSCKQALEVLTKETMPIQWGMAMGTLALACFAYRDERKEKKAENLELSIEACEHTLEVVSREAMPLNWATMMMTLGFAYRERIEGDKAENLELSIKSCKLALEVYTKKTIPLKWAITTMILASSYRDRIKGNKIENLELVIKLCKQVLEIYTKETMPLEWAMTTSHLAYAYNQLASNRVETLELAIESYKQVLEVYARETTPLEWAETINNLANTYNKRTRGDRTENLELAIELYKQSLNVYTKETTPLEWAETINNLASTYYLRKKESISNNLELAIELYKQSLNVYTKETLPQKWAIAMSGLALAYSDRVKGNKADNLDQAIKCYKQVLQIITRKNSPTEWASIMNNLVPIFAERINGDKAKNIEQAIKAGHLALKVRDRETMPIEWAETMVNLSFAYAERIQGDRGNNIEQAIKAGHLALEVITCENNPLAWAKTMVNLGNNYSIRIKGDRVENREQAIENCNAALKIISRENNPLDWAQAITCLAVSYQVRIKGKQADNLEMAIELGEKALLVKPYETMPFDWALIKLGLASAYTNLTKGDRVHNLEEAIEASKAALQVMTRETMPIWWARVTRNLAIAISNLVLLPSNHAKGNKEESLEQVIGFHNAVLEVVDRITMPFEWAMTIYNLAIAYRNRIRGDQIENIETSIKLFKQALEVFSPDLFPDDCRQVASRLASLYFQEYNWTEAVTPYEKAIKAADNLYKASILRYSKEAELTENHDLYHLAAYSFARIGDLRKAVIILERAKARRLSEVLERERTDLEQIQKEYPNVYKSYQDAVVNLRQLDNEELRGYTISPEHKRHLTPDELRAWASKAKSDLDAAIEKINAIPGYEKFLTQPDFDDIENALEPDCPLVYLVTTPAGSLSLIISKSSGQEDSEKISIRPIWSGSFVQSSVTEILDNWFSAYEEIKKVQEETPDEEKEKARKLWLETIEKTTKVLWKELMGEVTQHLLEIKAQQTVLIPMGHLALLPLHSAWTELDGKCHYALDDIAFTYAPSAVALSHSRQFAEKVSVQKLLAVVEPKPTAATELPNANIEADAVASLFKSPNIFKHEDATRSAVLEKLPEADIVHFACHGETNLQEPLKSGLLMAENEMITAGDLFQLGLKGARMATLSSCETGIVGVNLPDEAIALPAAFLQAGFAGVVSSLWFVDDLSTAMLMERFYHLWQSEGVPPARALQKAQQWLRDTTNKEKAEHFKRYVPSLSVTRMPKDVANKLYKIFTKNYVQNECSFEHPFYWAAFCLTGI